MKSVLLFFLLLFLIFLDQLTKHLVLYGFRFKWGFFEITLVYNEGSAFGLKLLKNDEYIVVNSIILFLFTLFIFYRGNRNRYMKDLYNFCLVFILSGGIGNIIDRIFHGKVIDFFYIYNFPVFNLADVFITLGIGMLIMIFFREEKKFQENSPPP
ncbi:MAG: signal peptidase II [Candidatus Calescibacterium sp.]|nr:signal peptidase II [Candidatus Calescibacterium sp.]MDW8132081.1 signal peptidase II [Candidatus Calescibacterium sp.]